MADEVRQRKPNSSEKAGAQDTTSSKIRKQAKSEDDASSKLDILRVLTFLILASTGLSYLVSGGDSFFWGLKNKPNYLQVNWWKAQFTGPAYYTLDQLKAFDGSDESKPVYLAVNGTIYDVSKGRHMYGPGGSYSIFAGRDASRAFVTGCFKEDLTADLRGLEEMYLPIEDEKNDAQWTSAELKVLREQEKIIAAQKVHDGLKHWADFFANNPKYQKVGYVKFEKDWLEKEPKRPLCPKVAKGRKKRLARDHPR